MFIFVMMKLRFDCGCIQMNTDTYNYLENMNEVNLGRSKFIISDVQQISDTHKKHQP